MVFAIKYFGNLSFLKFLRFIQEMLIKFKQYNAAMKILLKIRNKNLYLLQFLLFSQYILSS